MSHRPPPRFLPYSALRAHRAVQHLFAGLLIMAALLAVPLAYAASPGGIADKPVVHQLLDAMAQNHYQRFVSQGTPDFAAIGEADFAQVAATVGPRLRQGYSVEHLGNLRQQGLDISVWKISFADQGDDLLATLNVTHGRVGGFFLR